MKSSVAQRTMLFFAAAALGTATPWAGSLTGYLRDQNWYARYASQPPGVGYYEFGLNANAGSEAPGGAASTDVFGRFRMDQLPAGAYTVASWDVWWRSAFAFAVAVPSVGTAPNVDLRLGATMWGYPAFWDDTGHHEFGQTFEATGPVSMIYVRCPFDTAYTLTVHAEGPGGPQVGASRSFRGGDQRPVYGFGEMPTQPGRLYYARIRTRAPATRGVLMQMDPRPDFADPMPGGCLWLGEGGAPTPSPDRDLGLVIMADDDGLLTDLFTRASGAPWSDCESVGQTFIARGSSLVSAAFWLADPSAPAYTVQVRADGPGGSPIGPPRSGKPARLFADPEMIVTWFPGECPLTPGQIYYAEVLRRGGGLFQSVYVNRSNPFAHGEAFRNGVAIPGTDLAGTLMEETEPGSALRPRCGPLCPRP